MTWHERYVKSDGTFGYKGLTPEQVARANALRVPPAYVGVFVNASPNAKVQAYGFDSKGRKQTIYHPAYVRQRARAKFGRLAELDRIMPALIKRVSRDAATGNEAAIAVMMLLECGFRIGNEKYARLYQSYGITTLERRHLKAKRNGIAISFVGKKGVQNAALCQQPIINGFLRTRMAAGIKANERVFAISSTDVNAYLTGYAPDMTSKDLRMWRANHLFKDIMRRGGTPREAIQHVAEHLHNTPAVCKTSYIDPLLVQHIRKKTPRL